MKPVSILKVHFSSFFFGVVLTLKSSVLADRTVPGHIKNVVPPGNIQSLVMVLLPDLAARQASVLEEQLYTSQGLLQDLIQYLALAKSGQFERLRLRAEEDAARDSDDKLGHPNALPKSPRSQQQQSDIVPVEADVVNVSQESSCFA